ncbi:hypothetical protein YPPY88_0916, partial [Yersinia pestis PY-88]
MAYSGSRSPRQ